MPATHRAALLTSRPFVRSVLSALAVLFELCPLIAEAILLKII